MLSLTLNFPTTVPGRFEELRPPNKTDIHDVSYIKMRIETASAKARTGGPGDTASVRQNRLLGYGRRDRRPMQDLADEQLVEKVWAGTIPINTSHGEPQPAAYNKAKPPKDYWTS